MTADWDSAPRIDETPDGLYLNIGKCIAGFEGIEFGLMNLFQVVSGLTDDLAHVIWKQPAQFSQRLRLLKLTYEAASQENDAFPQRPEIDLAPVTELNEIIRRAERLGERRNEIAHSMVAEIIRDDRRGYLLVPSLRRPLKEFGVPDFSYNASEIAALDRDIDALGEDLGRFIVPMVEQHMLARKLAAQQRSSPPPTPPGNRSETQQP